MTAHAATAADEQRWASWLIERNRRGLRVGLWIVAIYHPSFAVLDYIVAPREWAVLASERSVSLLVTLLGFAILRTRFFDRHATWISSAYLVSVGASIASMIPVIGGFSSPYYAGLNLTMVGGGLLFVWPGRTAVVTHGLVVALYVVPNVLVASLEQAVMGTANIFFVVGTAVIVVVGQQLGYRTQRRQVLDRIALERTKANLEQAHEQLKQLDRFKSRFFANITHELKTPLAMVLSPLDLMLEGELGVLTEPQRATVGTMLRHGLKLLKLIGDLLDLSRLEHSHVLLDVQEHEIVGWLRGLVAQVEPLALRKELTVRFETNVERSFVWCDLDQLERVFVNLLSNATKFTRVGGHVTVRLEEDGAELRVAVADDGPGFPATEKDRIFDRFYQVEMDDTRRHGGTGIGLALAKELIELHGGRISASSEKGQGATFTVVLLREREHFDPAVLDRSTATRERLRSARGDERGLADWLTHLTSRGEYRLLEIDDATDRRVVERDPDEGSRGKTVLVVEDSPDVIRVVHMALRHHFRVLAAGDGRRGLELARKEVPDLVVTDLMMPELDGLGLTRELRSDPRTRAIPIVMLTARGDLDDRVRGLEGGVDAYLVKPFAARELLSTVQSLLKLRHASAELLLTQRMDSLEIVAGGLAHQINNPLGYVKNALELARRDVETIAAAAVVEPSPADRARIDKAAERLGKMFAVATSGLQRISETVELMTQYSREGYTRVPQPFDVFAAARRVVDMIRPSTGREVVLECDCHGDGTVLCVPQEIVQALTNLVQNAVEAVSDGLGRVAVRGEATPGGIVLRVIDNGRGILPEQQRRLFTPFYTTKGVGHGMGLTITWRVVDSLGGTIDVDSRVGEGTTFEVRLPRRPVDTVAGAAPGVA